MSVFKCGCLFCEIVKQKHEKHANLVIHSSITLCSMTLWHSDTCGLKDNNVSEPRTTFLDTKLILKDREIPRWITLIVLLIRGLWYSNESSIWIYQSFQMLNDMFLIVSIQTIWYSCNTTRNLIISGSNETADWRDGSIAKYGRITRKEQPDTKTVDSARLPNHCLPSDANTNVNDFYREQQKDWELNYVDSN